MVKAKEFWSCICDSFDFRFFSGVPCRGLAALYNTMHKDFLHYIPASNEQIALGLVNGAYLAGFNSAALVDINRVSNLDLDFNLKNSIPMLIISSVEFYRGDLFSINLTDNYEDDLRGVITYIAGERKPGVLIINEGVLI